MKFSQQKDVEKYLPRDKYNLDDEYDNLLKYCNEWDKIYFQKMFSSVNFNDVIKNDKLENIKIIYDKLKQKNKEGEVTKFLLDLVNLNQYEFLIPYACLTSEVPKEYSNIHFGMLGMSDNLLDMIN